MHESDDGGLTDVPGIKVGDWTGRRAATGCTALVCPPETVGGVDVSGAAPGTRETFLGLQAYAEGRDEVAAEAWQSGVAAGHPLAMVALGDQEVRAGLEEGWAEDGLKTAHGWYRKAADAGSPLGMSKLAWLYDEGHHVAADEAEATAWYMKAAEA